MSRKPRWWATWVSWGLALTCGLSGLTAFGQTTSTYVRPPVNGGDGSAPAANGTGAPVSVWQAAPPAAKSSWPPAGAASQWQTSTSTPVLVAPAPVWKAPTSGNVSSTASWGTSVVTPTTFRPSSGEAASPGKIIVPAAPAPLKSPEPISYLMDPSDAPRTSSWTSAVDALPPPTLPEIPLSKPLSGDGMHPATPPKTVVATTPPAKATGLLALLPPLPRLWPAKVEEPKKLPAALAQTHEPGQPYQAIAQVSYCVEGTNKSAKKQPIPEVAPPKAVPTHTTVEMLKVPEPVQVPAPNPKGLVTATATTAPPMPNLSIAQITALVEKACGSQGHNVAVKLMADGKVEVRLDVATEALAEQIFTRIVTIPDLGPLRPWVKINVQP